MNMLQLKQPWTNSDRVAGGLRLSLILVVTIAWPAVSWAQDFYFARDTGGGDHELVAQPVGTQQSMPAQVVSPGPSGSPDINGTAYNVDTNEIYFADNTPSTGEVKAYNLTTGVTRTLGPAKNGGDAIRDVEVVPASLSGLPNPIVFFVTGVLPMTIWRVEEVSGGWVAADPVSFATESGGGGYMPITFDLRSGKQHIYWGIAGEIERRDLDGSNPMTFSTTGNAYTFYAADFDYLSNKIWTVGLNPKPPEDCVVTTVDVASGEYDEVYRIPRQTCIQSSLNLGSPQGDGRMGLKVDVVNGFVYWTSNHFSGSSFTGHLYQAKLNGSSTEFRWSPEDPLDAEEDYPRGLTASFDPDHSTLSATTTSATGDEFCVEEDGGPEPLEFSYSLDGSVRQVSTTHTFASAELIADVLRQNISIEFAGAFTGVAVTDRDDCFSVTKFGGGDYQLRVGEFGETPECLLSGNHAGCKINPNIFQRDIAPPWLAVSIPALPRLALWGLGLLVVVVGCGMARIVRAA